MLKQETVQVKCDSIVEDTQALMDKSLLLENGVFLKPILDDTTHVCGRKLDGLEDCKGFITTYPIRYFGSMTIYQKSYCSNALCDFNVDKPMGVKF